MSTWTNKKHGKRKFRGTYRYYGSDEYCYEREFVLVSTTGKRRNISFESHEAAKSIGWKKVK